MVERGQRLTMRPGRTDDAPSAIGRVAAVDDEWMCIRTGPHVWLSAGSSVECSIAGANSVTTFVGEVEKVTVAPHFTVSMRRPESAEALNRRIRPRVVARQLISWSRLDANRQLLGETTGWTLDLSETGCRFESTGGAPDRGELIAMAIELPVEQLTCLGYTMGVDDVPGPQLTSRSIIRVGFAAMNEARRDGLQRWIDQQRGSLLDDPTDASAPVEP